MRTVTLELLRHGPPNNQLLSPLTSYLALCENHEAVTVKLPFEHNQFLHRLSALSYKHGAEPRNFYIKDTAKVLGELFSSIPGLTAELSDSGGGDGDDKFTHLRLVVSSSELALLPFEVALSPNGFPGTGQHMLLQPQAPICITREVRRVVEPQKADNEPPKILVAAASPPGFNPVPLQAHLLALRTALAPWLPTEDPKEYLEKYIVVLPRASEWEIQQKCAEHEFSHIHILAHGVEYQDGYDNRFGLALHNPRNPDAEPSKVDGARLAAALRPTNKNDVHNLARPSVVTLASCNSGNQGSVAGVGASLAHTLHDAGIPLVIASQFPLTYQGSVRMVETLYEGLLWGEDPRAVLYELRRKLFAQFPNNHDWASITAYASFSPTHEDDLKAQKFRQAHRSVEVALSEVDRAIRNVNDKSDPEKLQRSLQSAEKRIELAKEKMEALANGVGSNSAEIFGRIASTDKRQAQLIHEETGQSNGSKVGKGSKGGQAQNAAAANKIKSHLNAARKNYWRSFEADRANTWGLVQHLSLCVVLDLWRSRDNSDSKTSDPDLIKWWNLAHAISRHSYDIGNKQTKAWAIGDLIELSLLASLIDGLPKTTEVEAAEENAVAYAKELVRLMGRRDFTIYSTQNQIDRYSGWFSVYANLDNAQRLAKKISNALQSTGDFSKGQPIN